jgi:hypothetical protein
MTTPQTPKCEQWHRDAAEEINCSMASTMYPTTDRMAVIIAKHDAKHREAGNRKSLADRMKDIWDRDHRRASEPPTND